MAQTIAIKIDVQDSGKISQLEQNLVKLRQRRSELNKLVREGATLTDKEAKELGELGTQATATANKINDLKNAVLKQNDAFKKSSGFVSGIKQGVNDWATSMIGVTAAIGATVAVVKNITGIIVEFDSAMASLQAITGGTDEQMVEFQKSVLDVSAATGKGASEIAKAFQLVGSAQPELLSSASALAEVTKQSVILAQAGGLDVPVAADALTLAMNQFGASANEAAMFTDILATSQQKGTAPINQLAESIKNVGSVARASGVDFETTNALLQGLAKGGLVGAEAGTKLRTILLRLAKTGRDDLNPATQNFNDILTVLSKEVTDVTSAQALFGEEAAAGALTLINQRGTVEGLTGALNEQGNALEQAGTITDTVKGKTERLTSTWERFVLSIEDGEGVFGQAASVILDGVNSILDGITNLATFDFESENIQSFGSEYLKALTGIDLGVQNVGVSIDNVTNSFKRLTAEQLKTEAVGKQITATYIKLGLSGKEAAAKLKELREGSVLKIGGGTVDEGGDGGTPELSQKEKDAINAKAVKIAEERKNALKRIEDEEAKNLQSKDEAIFNFEFELEQQRLQNEQKLIVDKEYKDGLTLQNEAQQEAERIEAEKTAATVKEVEALKREATLQTLNATAGLLNAFASLAEDNSAEQKALATAGAIINTYAAINGTLAAFSGLPIPGYALLQAAAIGVTGFANVAKIQGVKFEQGGILNGASHANGGIPFTVAGRSGFEAEGGEAIINKRSTAMFTPILSAINQAGGGKAFFANGGLTPSSTGVTASQQSASSMLNFDIMADKIVNGINSKEVINVATNTSRVANQVQNVVNNSKF